MPGHGCSGVLVAYDHTNGDGDEDEDKDEDEGWGCFSTKKNRVDWGMIRNRLKDYGLCGSRWNWRRVCGK